MLEKEIEILKEYIAKDKEKLEAELIKIEERIEIEATEFFSRYRNKEIDEPTRNEFKNSLRDIYNGKLMRKREVLDSIASKVSDLEHTYC